MPSKSEIKHLLQALLLETGNRTMLLYAAIVLFLISVIVVLVFSRKEATQKKLRIICSVNLILSLVLFLITATLSKSGFELSLNKEPLPITGPQIEMDDGEGFENLAERDLEYFSQYYLDGKRVSIHDSYRDLIPSLVFIFALPDRQIDTTEEILLSPSQVNWLLSVEHYHASEESSLFWITGEQWSKSANIIVAGDQINNIYFIPETVFLEMQSLSNQALVNPSDPYRSVTNQRTGFSEYPPLFMQAISDIPNRELRQLLFLFAFFLIGALLCLLNPVKLPPFLAACLSFPLGLALVSSITVVLLFLNISISLFSLSVGVFLFFILYSLTQKRAFHLSQNQLVPWLVSILIFTLLAWYFIQKQTVFTTSDSRSILLIGHRMAIFGKMQDFLGWFSARGFFTSSIISLGYLCGIDIPYAFIPLLFSLLCLTLPVLFLGMFRPSFSDRKNKYIVLSFCALSFLLTYLCQALHLHEYWILNNLPAAFFILIFLFGIIYSSIFQNSGLLLFSSLSAMVFICLRSEGAIHIAFFLCILPVLQKNFPGKYKFIISIVTWTLFWNLLHYFVLGFSYDSYFWSSTKGALVCFAMCAALGANLLLDHKSVAVSFIRKYYARFFFTALFTLSAIAVIIKPDFFQQNLFVFIHHFISPSLCALTVFFISVFPYIFFRQQDTQRFLLISVYGYLLLTFTIFLFRTDEIHTGYTDSAMRLIVQIIPSAILCMTASLYSCLETHKTQTE